MKEGEVYEIKNEEYICIKDASYVVFEFLEKGLLGEFKEIDNYVLLKIKNINEIKAKKELCNLKCFEIFDSHFLKHSIKEYNGYEIREYIIISDGKNIKQKQIVFGYLKYKLILNLIIEDFVETYKTTEDEMHHMLRNLEKNQFGMGSPINDFRIRLAKSEINRGLATFSLEKGKTKAKKWFEKQLDEYKMSKLIDSI